MDSNFVMQVQTLNIPAGAGSVSLDRVTTNVVIKPTGYDVSWIADITTDADPAYVLVQIKQDGRTIHKEYMNTPAISKTITASSTSCKPLELVITAQCNSVQNTVTIPSPIDPIIQIFGYFPDPTQPTEITADPNTQVSNPGTVLFHVINNDPGSQIAWKLQNLENQAIIDSGTFTNEHVWVTNNMRLVKLLAYADVPGTCAAKVYSAPVQIYLETPQWKLPAVAYNDITIAATNIVQYNKG